MLWSHSNSSQHKGSSGYDSPKQTPWCCLNPPAFGNALPGHPQQHSGLSSTPHMFSRAGPVKGSRWAWGDPTIVWSPVTPWVHAAAVRRRCHQSCALQHPLHSPMCTFLPSYEHIEDCLALACYTFCSVHLGRHAALWTYSVVNSACQSIRSLIGRCPGKQAAFLLARQRS